MWGSGGRGELRNSLELGYCTLGIIRNSRNLPLQKQGISSLQHQEILELFLIYRPCCGRRTLFQLLGGDVNTCSATAQRNEIGLRYVFSLCVDHVNT
jgi:hypothetical protein